MQTSDPSNEPNRPHIPSNSNHFKKQGQVIRSDPVLIRFRYRFPYPVRVVFGASLGVSASVRRYLGKAETGRKRKKPGSFVFLSQNTLDTFKPL